MKGKLKVVKVSKVIKRTNKVQGKVMVVVRQNMKIESEI